MKVKNNDLPFDLDDRTHEFLVRNRFPTAYTVNNPPKQENLWRNHKCIGFTINKKLYILSHVTSKPIEGAQFVSPLSFDPDFQLFLKDYNGVIFEVDPENFKFNKILTSRLVELLHDGNEIILKYNDIAAIFKKSTVIDKTDNNIKESSKEDLPQNKSKNKIPKKDAQKKTNIQKNDSSKGNTNIENTNIE